jgi:hypothetical protein
MALQSNVDLRLSNGLLPVSYVFFYLFPICNFAFINICLSPMHFTAPTQYKVLTFQVAIIISLILFQRPGQFCSV